nr:PREDICTED: nephrin isoform X1 [Lepisosteus oculatus]
MAWWKGLGVLSCGLLLLALLRCVRLQQQVIRVQPDNVTVRAGERAVVLCEVAGPAGAVQWVKDGLLLGPNRSLPGFPRYSMTGDPRRGQYHLQIGQASLEDDSPYECQVGRTESSGPIVSHTVWVTVLIPPAQLVISEATALLDVPWVAGEEYTVTCRASDAKPAVEIAFIKSGVEQLLTESSSTPGSQDKLSDTEAVVKVTAQSTDHRQRLVCRASSPALPRPLETSFIMAVLFPPQPPVIEGLDSEEVKEGDTLKLVCTSGGGNPLATLQWTKNEEVLSSSWEVDSVSRRASSPLSLKVGPEDNLAQLTCESTNPVTPVPLRHTIMLRVVFLPSQVKVLGSFSAPERKNISLSCYTSSSNPPVHIRWWLGSRELNSTEDTVTEGAHGGMVTMSNVTYAVSREENGLQLTCEAFNEAVRFSRVHSAPLRVFYPPQKVWIDAPPQGKRLRSGTTVRLMCYCSGGNPLARLTWLKNNKPVRDVPAAVTAEKVVSRELILLLEPSDNQATYSCNASNEAKAPPLAAGTKLHVQFAAISVKITAGLKEVRRGQTLTLVCVTGSSNPVTNISWVMNGQKLRGVNLGQKRSEYGGVSVKSQLSVNVSSFHNTKRVTCQAYTQVLSEGVNTFYRFNVLYPPEFAPDQPKVVQAVEKGVALLPLRVSANPEPISCNWTYRGEHLGKEGSYRYHLKEGGTLEIWNVTRADAGQYRVICRNAEGENYTQVTLDVQYAPAVRSLLDPTEVDLGGTAEMTCTADANPVTPGMFSWKWLGEDERELTAEMQKAEDATGWLIIPGAKKSDSGSYQCSVDNGIGPPASAEVRLVVRFKPEIQKGAQWSKVASRGDGSSTAEVVCQAEGVPRVQFSWAKNGVPLDFNNPRYSEQTVWDRAVHTSTVTVVNVSAALDYAIFTCSARNALGLDQLDIQLVSTNRPDPPSGFKVVSVTHNSVTLQWTEGFDGGLEQKFRVRYRWEGATSFLYIDVFPPRATSFTVTGLRSSTPYNFSVNAINAMGESLYADSGALLNVTTKERPRTEVTTTPTRDPQPTEAPGQPLYLVVTLAVVGGVLLVLNSALAGCLIRKWQNRRRQAAGTEGKRSDGEGSTLTEPNRYEGGEQINSAARRTLLLDSGSEPGSSLYESYDGDSAHRYYPASDFRPSLYSHPESSEGRSEDTHGILADLGYRPGLVVHDYEDVRDWGLYEEVGVPSLYYPSHGERFRPLGPQNSDAKRAYQRRGRGLAELEEPIRTYDTVTEYRPAELPFELRGELV